MGRGCRRRDVSRKPGTEPIDLFWHGRRQTGNLGSGQAVTRNPVPSSAHYDSGRANTCCGARGAAGMMYANRMGVQQDYATRGSGGSKPRKAGISGRRMTRPCSFVARQAGNLADYRRLWVGRVCRRRDVIPETGEPSPQTKSSGMGGASQEFRERSGSHAEPGAGLPAHTTSGRTSHRPGQEARPV